MKQQALAHAVHEAHEPNEAAQVEELIAKLHPSVLRVVGGEEERVRYDEQPGAGNAAAQPDHEVEIHRVAQLGEQERRTTREQLIAIYRSTPSESLRARIIDALDIPRLALDSPQRYRRLQIIHAMVVSGLVLGLTFGLFSLLDRLF